MGDRGTSFENKGDKDLSIHGSSEAGPIMPVKLVNEFGISAGRITTDGKGSFQPIADYGTPEGKANNRRLEFTKLKLISGIG
jgi:hypothetical protein